MSLFRRASRVIAIATATCTTSIVLADIPRTESGLPDLNGTYNIATLTPLERPQRYGNKKTVTVEEAKEIEAYWAANLAKDEQKSDPNRDAPDKGGSEFFIPEFEGAAGGVGGYNAFYIDLGNSTFKLDGEYRTSIITSPENGRRPSLSKRGQAALAAMRDNFHENTGTAWWIKREKGPYDNPENRPLAERCLLGFGSTAGPPALPVMYNNLKRIIQTDSTVIIINEMNHDARVVRMNAEHLPAGVTKWMGDSVGRWEGDTLVVSTKNFRDQTALFLGSEELHVEERFSRIDDKTIRYAFTVTDPNWNEPWSGEYPWPAAEDKMFEYACHEGNYALGGILRGARILEEEALTEAGAGPAE